MGNIRASAGLTLLSFIDFSLIHYFFDIDVLYFTSIFFGGTFVGMSCPTKVTTIEILISACFFALFFIFLVPLVPGMGGALGLSAFLSVVQTKILHRSLFKKVDH